MVIIRESRKEKITEANIKDVSPTQLIDILENLMKNHLAFFDSFGVNANGICYLTTKCNLKSYRITSASITITDGKDNSIEVLFGNVKMARISLRGICIVYKNGSIVNLHLKNDIPSQYYT